MCNIVVGVAPSASPQLSLTIGCPLFTQSDTLYNAGELSPIWLWNGVYPGNSVGDLARANMTILYPGGDTWRNTVVTFLEDPTLEHPTIEMTGEDPYLQYNFVIKSKELGFRHVEFPCWE